MVCRIESLKGRDHLHMYQIRKQSAETSTEEYLKQYVDVKTITANCRNCPNYNTRWSCPPHNFDVEKLWTSFHTLHLSCVQIVYDSDIVLRAYTKEGLSEILHNSLDHEKRQLRERLEARLHQLPGSAALASGCCELCSRCARRSNLPCRFPYHMHYSIESLGGDVVKTAHDFFGIELKWMGDNRLPEYFTLIGGILLNPQPHSATGD